MANIRHAFNIGYQTRIAGRSWINHHYQGIEKEAYEAGVMAAVMQLKAIEMKHQPRVNT